MTTYDTSKDWGAPMTEQETKLLHLLVEKLDGHSVDLAEIDDNGIVGERKAGFSVGRSRSIRLEDIIEVCTPAVEQPKSLPEQILELAAKDRETTLNNVFAALEELGAVRPLIAGIAYDPLLIGAHREAKYKMLAQMMEALETAEVITFNQSRLLNGGARLDAVLMVVLPANSAVAVDPQPEQQEPLN